MRILIVSQYYYPEPVEKIHDLARGLVQKGHKVQVITSFPCYPAGRIYHEYRQKFIMNEELDGVSITRIPQVPDHSRSVFRRALYYLSFAFSATIAGLANRRSVDLILVYQAALPVGLSGRLISYLRGVPLVLDVVDLWPESVVASGMLTNEFAIKLIRKAAEFIYRGANHVIVVTNGFKRRLTKMGIPQDMISVIHNWMPTSTYHVVKPRADLAESENLAGRFNVIYAGSMGPVQDLHTVLAAAALLTDLPEIQLVLIGDGLEYEDLVKSAKQRNLNNVRFLGRRLPEEMPGFYALADVLLVHLKPDPLSDVSIPSKTFAYMACGRPVLMAVKGEAQEFVKENYFGIGVEPSNPRKMAEAIRCFYALPSENRNCMGQAALNAYSRSFCSEVQISKFENILTAIVQTKKQ
jgi:glycosyltransferase involved in cell wall biosynthesis